MSSSFFFELFFLSIFFQFLSNPDLGLTPRDPSTPPRRRGLPASPVAFYSKAIILSPLNTRSQTRRERVVQGDVDRALQDFETERLVGAVFILFFSPLSLYLPPCALLKKISEERQETFFQEAARG